MTRDERSELATVVRMRAKLAREDADVRGAELMAQFEEELATEYPANDPRLAEITEQAADAMRRADAEIAAVCEAAGIRSEFRAGLHVVWHGRGENGVEMRRTELRKVAQSRITAMVKTAKLAITRAETEARGRLAELSMTTSEGKALMESMPTVEYLLPTLALRQIEAETPHHRWQW
jgi:hypothetical protein